MPGADLSWDVLSYIFKLVQTEEVDANFHCDPREYSVPEIFTPTLPFQFVVSHVNRHWRGAALCTASLWATLFVVAGTPVEQIQAQLKRSEGCPLDVILVRDDRYGQIPDAQQEMFDLAFSEVHRWRRFWFDSSREDADSPFLSRLALVCAPALEHLTVHFRLSNRSHLGQEDPLVPQMFSGGCPHLDTIRLRGLAIYLTRPPLSSVTTLYIDHTKWMPVNPHQLEAVLNACPTLTKISLFGDVTGDNQWPAVNSIQLPNLRTISISSIRSQNYANILLMINAPLLQKIMLKDAREHDLDAFLFSPHADKFPLVQSLAFCYSDFTVLKYYLFCTTFPKVSELTIVGNHHTPSILNSISDPRHFSPDLVDTLSLWPHLKVLNIILNADLASQYHNSELGFVWDAFERRVTTGHGPTKLRLGTSEDVEDVPVEHLVGCIDYEWLKRHVSVEIMEDEDLWRRYCERL